MLLIITVLRRLSSLWDTMHRQMLDLLPKCFQVLEQYVD